MVQTIDFWIPRKRCVKGNICRMMLSKEEEEVLEPNSFDLLSIEEQLQSIHNTHEVVFFPNRKNILHKCQKILIQLLTYICFRDQIF